MSPDRKYMYKLPWSTNDNQGGWVEVTDRCDLSCPGCYRKSLDGDRPLEALKKEITNCQTVTNCDVMVVAGGEPLLYPQITELISFIRQRGMKSLILSNGTNFTEKLAGDLKKAGLNRIHFHIDSRQNREGWTGKNEKELNSLRDHYATMISKMGGMQCGFHIVIGRDNLNQIQDIISWYRINMSRVHHLSLIAWRGLPKPEGYRYMSGSTFIDPSFLDKFYPGLDEMEISTDDMFDIIRKEYPDYLPAAYINGTAFPDTNKYLIFVNIGAGNRFYGCFGAKSMELSQVFYHLFKGRYISFSLQPAVGKKVFLLSVFDRQVRKAFRSFLQTVVTDPVHLFRKVYLQSLILQQPVEFIHGERNRCDPCINPMLYGEKAINPCQLDEYRLFGGVLNMVKL